MKALNNILTLFLVLSVTEFLSAQHSRSDITSVLNGLFKGLLIRSDDNEKLRINDSVRVIIDQYVKSDSVFTHRFNEINRLGQISSPDGRVKIITWNLLLADRKSKYFSYIITRPGRAKEQKIYFLEGEYSKDPIRSDTTYSPADWYGALYYDIRPVKRSSPESWVILGIDYGNDLITRKIIEVLSFTDEGDLMFGRKWFASGDKLLFRKVFEYSAEAVMSLRFTHDRSIVFDHLVPLSPSLSENRQYYAPDYSYDAYYYKGGMWKMETNVDIRNMK